MKAKLITDGKKNYSLLDYNNELVATTMESVLTNQKLSLKNCQAIEKGYDLEELAKKIYPDIIFEEDDFEISGLPYQWGFKLGFLKCLELMGDKKFSEDDVKKIINWSTLDEDVRLSEEEFFQSLQQTEWDVEIEMEKVPVKMPGVMVFTKAPKLDADGCLILKRI